jgi:tetratricopeptide (TPR) repeat protein
MLAINKHIAAICLLAASGCAGEVRIPGTAPETDAPRELPDGAEAWSFLGDPLSPAPPSDAVRAVYEANLEEASATFEATPQDADALIWYGRRLAYLGQFRDAIDVFTEGVALHPEDARMVRHRGHRYVSVRELDLAIADFRTAADLVRGLEDDIEPDGIPNARGIPTSTLHFNIWYHLGLAHYLAGDFELALEAWNECLSVSRHLDSVVATTYWLNNTLRRLGRTEEAEELLIDLPAADEIIESTAYLDVLLLHTGEQTAENLVGPMGDDATLGSTTTAYGVAVWHLVNGRGDTAFRMFEAILENRSQWPAFGYIAAEAEVARMNGAPVGGGD